MKPPTIEEMKGREPSRAIYDQKVETWHRHQISKWKKDHPTRLKLHEFAGDFVGVFFIFIFILVGGTCLTLTNSAFTSSPLTGLSYDIAYWLGIGILVIQFVVFPVLFWVTGCYYGDYPHRDKWYDAQADREMELFMADLDRAGI